MLARSFRDSQDELMASVGSHVLIGNWELALWGELLGEPPKACQLELFLAEGGGKEVVAGLSEGSNPMFLLGY